MQNFITNSPNKELKKRLSELIHKSKELKFLVGFFYFSGISELYTSLKSNPNFTLKVLVGLDIGNFASQIVEFAEDSNSSDKEKTHKFFESLKRSINTEIFDTKEFYEQVIFFIELVKADKLIIRKTYEPNHAKLYLFKLEEGQVGRQNLFITGSSNLTKAGLTTQNEFNVELSDYGFEDAEKYFDELWLDAVKITENTETKNKLIDVIENKTLIKNITPFEAYVLVLKTYLDSYEGKSVDQFVIKTLEEKNYKPYRYQIDAVKQALAVIENHNGVIIADVVGLGKTIIACATARQLKKRGIVICPPGILGDKNSGWVKYLEEFHLASFGWEVRSLGDLEDTLDFVTNADDIEVIIVDEAHRFRNQDTEGYELLRNICRNKIVILLTATPFNNRPADILALLKLFIVPKKSTITLSNNLVDQFRSFKTIFDRLGFIKKYCNSSDSIKRGKAINFYKSLFGEAVINLTKVTQHTHYLAKQIRHVIEPVTIRRNRLDLQGNPDYNKEVNNLSTIAPPKEWFYELTNEQSIFYDQIITEYFGDPDDGGKFKGAIYQPFIYEKGYKEGKTLEENREYLQQRNLFDFMRRMMVKRFESSFGSFEQSLKNFIKINNDAITFIEKTGEYILDRTLLEKIYTKSLDEIEKALIEYEEKINAGEYPKNHKRYKLNNDFKFKDEFKIDIAADVAMFEEILSKMNNLKLSTDDPKSSCLLSHLKKELSIKSLPHEPKRKIIIFSEYVDTVNYLNDLLSPEFGDRLLVVAGDLSKSKIDSINNNFDASLSYKLQDDSFDILLTSDKISEGFNLNRAGMIINYDIPWNPVRVIQRVGRINRISKKVFEKLFIVNFFPTERGAELVKSREIAQNKMYLIHNALGEDARIFDVDEEPTPAGLYQRIQQSPDENEQESFYTKVYKDFKQIQSTHPSLIKSLNSFPPRVKVSKKFDKNELLVFFKKGRLYTGVYDYTNNKATPNPSFVDFEDVYTRIKCTEAELGLEWNTAQFWDAYEKVKHYKEGRSIPTSEQSIEQKALIVLKYLIDVCQNESIIIHKDFLRKLRDDILDFGTLSDFTLRRIANFETTEDKIGHTIPHIESIEKELGEDFLEKEIKRLKYINKEIIIAIENKSK